MTLIKPSFVESLFHTFFNLDPDRPKYYNLVFDMARNIFLQCGVEEKAEALNQMIQTKVEYRYRAPLFAVLEGYYNPRFMFSKHAYCKIGNGIDAKVVTRFEMTTIFEEIKAWCYDEVGALTPYIRFTSKTDIMG